MKEHGKVDQIGTEQIDQIRVGRTTVKHFGFMGGGEAYWVPMETAFLSMGHSQNDLKEAVAKKSLFSFILFFDQKRYPSIHILGPVQSNSTQQTPYWAPTMCQA